MRKPHESAWAGGKPRFAVPVRGRHGQHTGRADPVAAGERETGLEGPRRRLAGKAKGVEIASAVASAAGAGAISGTYAAAAASIAGVGRTAAAGAAASHRS